MSLKAVHIIFIAASTLLCLVFGGWSLNNYWSGEGSLTDLVLGLASLISGLALIVYGRYFLRKLRAISYL